MTYNPTGAHIMLILDRKQDQSIMIGDIEVRITEIKGEHVKVGIKAPKDILVYRKEIYDRIKAENIRASQQQIQPDDLQDFFKS